MNRIDRLFNILLILQRRKLVRAADLAAEFEVSPRTIYRDLTALGEMGVPLIATPSEGYALVEGFYLPPLTFTTDEAQALFLGSSMIAAQASGELAQTAASATEKIAHNLPDKTRRRAEGLRDIIHFNASPQKFDLGQPHLLQLQTAICDQRTVHMAYHSYRENAPTERVVEPHFLTYSESAWYVTGYCRLREDTRSFRLDRITGLTVLAEQFNAQRGATSHSEYLLVRVRFLADSIRWVRERQHYAFRHDEAALPNGDTIMLYVLEDTSEIRSWLLGWGAQAEVLEPASLRAEIRAEAETLLALLT